MAKPDYATKCPASTQAEEQQKADDMEAELKVIQSTIAQFEAGQ